MTAENHNVLGGFVADEQYEGIVCVGQQGVVVDVFLEDTVPVVLVIQWALYLYWGRTILNL